MNEVYIKTNTHSIFENLFKNEDLISIKDLLDMLEKQYWEIQRLMEKIEDLEIKKEPDYYDIWHDQQLEQELKNDN